MYRVASRERRLLMASIRSRVPTAAPSTNGDRAAPSPVSLASPTRRRPSWVLLGALLVGLAGLIGAWVFVATSERMSVVVAARDLDPGEVVGVSDLRVVEMGRSGDLRAIESSQQELILGRSARGPIPAGTVLNTDLFAAEGESIPSGQVVVGAALEPGAVPVGALRAGDRVDVLGVARTTAAAIDPAATTPVAEVLAVGTVWSVEPAGTGTSTSRVWVALLVPADTQGVVAQAAADGLLRLSLVGVDG